MSAPTSFYISPTCTAFDAITIGTKVGQRNEFNLALSKALSSYDDSEDDAPGQHAIMLNPESIGACDITCGVGRRLADPDCYRMANWRGRVNAYLKREYAAEASTVKVIVYTREAFLSDPQVKKMGITNMIETHVVVAVLANPSDAPDARSAFRLVDCLAGNNNEAAAWSAEKIRELASASLDMETNWSVVYG